MIDRELPSLEAWANEARWAQALAEERRRLAERRERRRVWSHRAICGAIFVFTALILFLPR